MSVTELDRTRILAGSKPLAAFTRNLTTWEVLLVLHTQPDLMISHVISALTTRQLSYSSTMRFIQEQIAAGTLQTSVGTKRSAKLVRLSPDVENALAKFLIQIGHQSPGGMQDVGAANI